MFMFEEVRIMDFGAQFIDLEPRFQGKGSSLGNTFWFLQN